LCCLNCFYTQIKSVLPSSIQQLVSTKLHIHEQFQVEKLRRKNRNTSYNILKNLLNIWVSIVNLLLRAYRFLDCVKPLCNSSPLWSKPLWALIVLSFESVYFNFEWSLSQGKIGTGITWRGLCTHYNLGRFVYTNNLDRFVYSL